MIVKTDRNNIYKVETVKDSFVGVSGAPERVRKGLCRYTTIFELLLYIFF